jgi:hypothetical protein
MTEKRFTVRKSGNGMFYSDGDYSIDNTIQFIIETVEFKLNELSNENEQLKQQLKDYHNAFDCSQCKYQNYDWFDDGNEFEVCDKGNHEELMYNHSCKDWEEL